MFRFWTFNFYKTFPKGQKIPSFRRSVSWLVLIGRCVLLGSDIGSKFKMTDLLLYALGEL